MPIPNCQLAYTNCQLATGTPHRTQNAVSSLFAAATATSTLVRVQCSLAFQCATRDSTQFIRFLIVLVS